MEWTKIDAVINKAARDNYKEREDINQQVGLSPNSYGEEIGIFEDGVPWAMKHYRLLGFQKETHKVM